MSYLEGEKGREDIMCGSLSASHWPRFYPRAEFTPLCFGEHPLFSKLRHTHSSSIYSFRNGDTINGVDPGLVSQRDVKTIAQSFQRSWYGISRLVILLDLSWEQLGTQATPLERRRQLKEIRGKKHTNLEFHGLLKLWKHATNPNLKNGLGDMRCNGKQGFNIVTDEISVVTLSRKPAQHLGHRFPPTQFLLARNSHNLPEVLCWLMGP